LDANKIKIGSKSALNPGERFSNLEPQSLLLLLKIIRRALRRTRARFEYSSLTGSPVLFANSFPKSGTHLLIQVLQGFARLGPAVDSGLPAILTFDGPSGEPRRLEVILKDLRRLREGDIAYGHLHALPEIEAELTKDGVATYFIYRDPRDVVVSHAHYITEMATNHIHHQYYTEHLKTFNDRLKTSILGLPEIEKPFPDVYQRFEPYLGWFESKRVLTLRFEDFITDRMAILRKILEHAEFCGFSLAVDRDQAIHILESAIQPEKSPTYRSGTTGRWRESFTEEHKVIFKEVAGDLLIRLGYEEDEDW
jgi:hypothetical protein